MTERKILGIRIPSLLPKEGYSVLGSLIESSSDHPDLPTKKPKNQPAEEGKIPLGFVLKDPPPPSEWDKHRRE